MIIYRGRVNDVVFEFLPPNGEPTGTIIICEGLPAVPKQKELMMLMADNGYFAIFPRYKGTWESSGQFLNESPTKDIEQIINLAKSGEISELYAGKKFEVPKKPIFLLGSSFGGSVALAFVNHNDVDKIIALSPIVNFKHHNDSGNEQNLLRLSEFLHKAFGETYRFNDEDMKRLASGELFEPPEKIKSERAKNILILYDRGDTEIDYKKIETYAEKNNIIATNTKNVGHLSFSKIPQEMWPRILQWLNKK